MFSQQFKCTIQHAKIKRLSEDKGGDLVCDLTIGAALSDKMAADLGDEVKALIDTDLQFKSVTIDSALEGLIVDAWHDSQDPMAGPYLSLTDVSTKKYKLIKEEDTGAILFTVTLKAPPISEADLVKVFHCLSRYVTVKLDMAQRDLGV